MNLARVALVFDDRTRPETTGVYCRRALESLVQVEFFHPERLADVPRSGFDLYLAIDDGFDYAWPAEMRPVAYWAIDTHLDFTRSLRRAANVDFVFAAQRDGAERLRAAGIVSAQWLPLACDPQMHRPHDVPKRFDVAFVGNLLPGPRTDLARLLRRHFRQSFFGQAYFDEMATIYSAARVAFNRSVRNDVNMRVFEAAACGPLLLTNDLAENGQAELLRDGVHLATYRDGEELLDKLRYYLRRDALRERIAAAGRAEVLEKHTYAHRMQKILQAVASVGSGLRAIPLGAECGARDDAESGWVGRVKRVPPSPETRPSLERQPEMVGLASSAHPTAFQHVDQPPSAGSGSLAEWATDSRGRLSHTAESVRDSDRGSATAVAESAVRGDARNGTESVPYSRNGLGSPPHRNEAAYFDFARPELLALVPASARRVLDVGCGTGRLGESLKARQPCEVTGVECDRGAAGKARERLDRVFVGNVERIELPFAAGEFDCIVCGDVLEHLARPDRFLRRARNWLAADGVLVASIPNVRHHGLVSGLLAGNWTYEPAGLLDDTHRHFFTRHSIEDLFARCGFAVKQLGAVPGPDYDEWQKQGFPGQLRMGGLAVNGLAREEAEEFFVYQYLVVVEPCRVGRVKRVPPSAEEPPSPVREPEMVGLASSSGHAAFQHVDQPPSAGSASPTDRATDSRGRLYHMEKGVPDRRQPLALPPCLLLMVTYNRLDYTRLALEAILRLDYPQLKIVIWDNASTDGTVDYLRRRLVGNERVRVIASPDNRGVVAPMNEVWQSDREAQLLAKIDNDTLVPDDLLRRLAECHACNERFGVLSGFHFRAEGEALGDERRIHSFDGVQVLPQPYVGGCAVMLRRTVYEGAGPIGSSERRQAGPFMDGGWTAYQQRLGDLGYINGYPWPPVHVEHMEDTRSPYCVRTAEHEAYKHALRGVGLEDFTRELCVWRPI